MSTTTNESDAQVAQPQVTIEEVGLVDEEYCQSKKGRSKFEGIPLGYILVLGGAVKRVADDTFQTRSGITALALLTKMEIGAHAFYFCENLQTLTTSAPVIIGECAFKYTRLLSVTLLAGSKYEDNSFPDECKVTIRPAAEAAPTPVGPSVVPGEPDVADEPVATEDGSEHASDEPYVPSAGNDAQSWYERMSKQSAAVAPASTTAVNSSPNEADAATEEAVASGTCPPAGGTGSQVLPSSGAASAATPDEEPAPEADEDARSSGAAGAVALGSGPPAGGSSSQVPPPSGAASTAVAPASKKQKVGPNAGVVSSGPDGILMDDASDPLGSNPDEAIAGGGCVAVALAKLGLFSSKEEAVAALDAQRDEWLSWTGPGRLREDQKCDAFLGKRGETWHRQIIQRTVKAAGYNYSIVPTAELNNTDMFLIDGVANDRYLQGETEKKGKWVAPYELDDPSDNPRDNARNWQHVIAIKDGKLCRTYTKVSMKWLHLVDGKPDAKTGFFIRIDKVYKLTKKSGS